MMTSTIQTANSPYIIIPQNSIHTAQSMQYTAPVMGPPVEQRVMFHQKFLKGQPKVLGTIQIMVSVMYILLGTILLFTLDGFVSISTYSGISYWGALFYIISGSLCIAAEHKQSLRLIRASLGMNIISSLVSTAAIGLYCTDIPYFRHNFYPSCTGWCNVYSDNVFLLRELALSFLLTASVLEFCVSVSISAFGCRSLEKSNIIPPQVIVISNDYHNQNSAVNPSQFANQLPLDPNINTLNPRNFNRVKEPTTIPEMNRPIRQPDHISANTLPMYPSLSAQ